MLLPDLLTIVGTWWCRCSVISTRILHPAAGEGAEPVAITHMGVAFFCIDDNAREVPLMEDVTCPARRESMVGACSL